MNARLFTWLARAEIARYPGRALLAVVAIALGLALGYGVHLVNASALAEFGTALRHVNGAADLQVRPKSGATFDEALYEKIAALPQVALASPVIEVEVLLPAQSAPPAQRERLRLYGIDLLRAARVTPSLLPAGMQPGGDPARLFDGDALWLSPEALQRLGKAVGDPLILPIAGRDTTLRIAGTLPGAPAGLLLGSIDIAALQWRFGMLGQLSRIDVQFEDKVDPVAARAAIGAALGPNADLVSEDDELARTASLSRSYRINLDMLAMMALFTGAWLVFTTQTLSVARRRTALALLRVLGVTRAGLMRQVLAEGALIGVAGALLGLGLGVGLAQLALHFIGGDLGGGYFRNSQPQLHFTLVPALVFALLAMAAALAGSLIPARAAARAQPAVALKAGGVLFDPLHRPRVWPALLLALVGASIAPLPAVDDVPMFAYLGMALLLFGGIALMPALARWVLHALAARPARAVGRALAQRRLWGAPGEATVAMSGIVTSVSLIVAMGVMIASFRQSVDDWLTQLLPADLYVRSVGQGPGFDAATQARLAALPGVAAVRFQKFAPLRLVAHKPPVTLIVRSVEAGSTDLPLVRGSTADRSGKATVWGSEAMADLYGWTPGAAVSLPVGGNTLQATVGGIWRDYARQHGAIVVRTTDYDRLTGDTARSDAGFTLAPGADAAAVREQLRAALPGANLELSSPAEIRRLSLRIFDRSFAVTYVLQAVAIAIGLLGVTATFAAQALARAREFGMLRHIGATRRELLTMLGWEGLWLGASGVAAGILLGLGLAQVLIRVVNPQSFHWTMDTHVPWAMLAAIAAALLAATAASAMLAGRQALSADAVRAVREDW